MLVQHPPAQAITHDCGLARSSESEKKLGLPKICGRIAVTCGSALPKEGKFVDNQLLASDPYQTLVPDLKTGYVIGKVQMYDKAVHQLAFTEKDAEYQLWVTGEPNPRIQSVEVINMALGHEPRVIIEFSDWNLNPQIQPDTFSFNKPADAKQIDFLQFSRQER